jgi:hypothetical protein|tara:strand:+ start:1158 stop:1295 length:138 start_codon:yes stop_codon:yes gene_type:complete
MARGLTLGNYIDKPRKKRPGTHAKSKSSKLKSSRNYTKPYIGQGK